MAQAVLGLQAEKCIAVVHTHHSFHGEEQVVRLNNQRQYRMGIEALEDKLLLAGDVTATVVDGNLMIRGDADSNGVAITSGDVLGEYLVGGLMAGDGPTSVNGNFHRTVVNGVSGNILVGMGDGDDLANFFDLRVCT